jgi:hypothetical protein
VGFWRRAFRPSCAGLFVEHGQLFFQHEMSDPAFRALTTAQARDEFLAPIPIPLQGARVFLDIEVGSRRPLSAPAQGTLAAPAVVPPAKGDKYYTISVHTADNDVYVGYPSSGGQARDIFRAIENLVRAAHAT